MFRKKENNTVNLNFTNWAEDLGFLTLMMDNKKRYLKSFSISIADSLLSEDYVKDEDVLPLVEESVKEVLDSMSEVYKEFLIRKYFGSNESLLSYISENIYLDIVSYSVNKNGSKIEKLLNKQRTLEVLAKNLEK